jgi:hypothetical protein
VAVVADPLSAAALAASVLTQGIGFVYGQVAELLRRRRDRHQSADATGPFEIPAVEEAGDVLAGQLAAGQVDEQALEEQAEQLARLWGLLAPYATGLMPVDPGNVQLVEQVEAARRLLERVYRQHITFRGERRPATGTPLDVEDDGDAGQYAAQVIASGERAVAVGRDISGAVTTGDQTVPGNRGRAGWQPSR